MWLIGTTALKCYVGEFENYEGVRKKEPQLRDCGRKAEFCISYYAKTKVDNALEAGSWDKRCDRTPRDTFTTAMIEEFDGDFSDRCIETKKDLMVCSILLKLSHMFETVNM